MILLSSETGFESPTAYQFKGIQSMHRDLIELAAEIAREAHEGQLYGDVSYFDYHIVGVVGLLPKDADPITIAAAYLHDVVEDTDITTDDLLARGIPLAVCLIVHLLTKQKGECEFEYLLTLAESPEALDVKIADATFNARGGRSKYKITVPLLKALKAGSLIKK